jgi:hypothetical protein
MLDDSRGKGTEDQPSFSHDPGQPYLANSRSLNDWAGSPPFRKGYNNATTISKNAALAPLFVRNLNHSKEYDHPFNKPSSNGVTR